MLHRSTRSWRLLLTTGTLVWLASVWGGASARAEAADVTVEIVAQWLEIADTVLANHVDPPTRQEMVKSAVQAVYKLAKQDPPVGLATKISRLGTDDELRAFLGKTLDPLIEENRIVPLSVRDVGIHGLLSKVTGSRSVIPIKELSVGQQLRDNRYVGIGIQLALKDHYPTMAKVFPRGPAWNAGGRGGDQMVSIDGLDAKDMPLARVVELLRGQEGKPTTVVVQRPGSAETLSLNMVRGVVPFDTVEGTERDEDQNWKFKNEKDPRIAHLNIASVRGSTPSELRRIAGQLHADDCRALVLDLRGTESGEIQHAAMVADALMGESPIGQVLGVHGRQQFDSTADQLFPGWPMVVLVDGRTARQAEWIAAALQDSRRAKLIGLPTAGQSVVLKQVELPSGKGGIQLVTGILFRGGGEPLMVPGQFSVEQSNFQLRRTRDEKGSFLYAPTVKRKTITPDLEVAAIGQMAEAVKLLQARLRATALQ